MTTRKQPERVKANSAMSLRLDPFIAGVSNSDRAANYPKATSSRVKKGVRDPNQPMHQLGYRANGMAWFLGLIEDEADALAYMTYPDGSAGAGVAREILEAHLHGLPVYRIVERELEMELP